MLSPTSLVNTQSQVLVMSSLCSLLLKILVENGVQWFDNFGDGLVLRPGLHLGQRYKRWFKEQQQSCKYNNISFYYQ